MAEVAAILHDRGRTNGDYVTMCNIIRDLKTVASAHSSGNLSSTQQESLDMIFHKIGRIIAGDPNHIDHWDDIAGYAKLANRE